MYLIVGLGNPGKEYAGTRHNMGFEAVDRLIDRFSVRKSGLKFKAMYGTFFLGGEKVMLAKPLTYMNLSGNAVRSLMDYYKIDAAHLIVISDDIHLPPGRIRIREKGSDGGQKGLKDIIAKVGTDEFVRIRIGVGEQKSGDLVNHVLGHFAKEDQVLVNDAILRAADAAECVVTHGAAEAMNRFNGSGKTDGAE